MFLTRKSILFIGRMESKQFSYQEKNPYRGRGRGGRADGWRQRKKLTHFLGVPVDDEAITKKIYDFQDSIYNDYSDRIYEEWFMPIPKLHYR
jgi:hypothetical protein